MPKVHFATNPCRIKFFDQEIIVFREDTMSRMLRNVVGVKPDVNSEDLKRYVCLLNVHDAFFTQLNFVFATVGSDRLGPSSPEPSDNRYSTHSIGLRSFPPLVPIAHCGKISYRSPHSKKLISNVLASSGRQVRQI